MTPFDKHRDMYQAKFTEGFFNIGSSKAVKPYKDVYQPYFSKASITRMEPLIHETLNTFLGKLDSVSKEAGKVVDLTLGFRCLTSDTIMRYCFADEGFQTLESRDFRSPMLIKMEQFFETIMPIIYFPKSMKWVTNQLDRLSDATQDKMAPGLAATNYLMNVSRLPHGLICLSDVEHRAARRKSRLSSRMAVLNPPSPPFSILGPTIPRRKRSGSLLYTSSHVMHSRRSPHLQSSSLSPPLTSQTSMFTAGTDTTAHTLTIGTWYLMKNPTMLAKLRSELRTAIPDADSNELMSAWTLEQLPYLNGIVKESIRLGYGVPGRLPRKVPAGGATFCGQHVPAGFAICSTAYGIHTNEAYFTNAAEFRPERWLGDEKLELEKKLVSFSRGTRSCLGMNMAYAEMYLTFAYVFRRFDLKPSGTVAKDIEEWKDCFLPMVRKHLEVTITPATK